MKLHDIDYFKYGKIENKKFWKRLGSKPDFKNKKVKALKSINTPKSVSARRGIEINSVISKREN